MNTSPASASPVDLAAESVAGEEDPGASIDVPAGANQGGDPGAPLPPLAPGDEAAPGTPGTGEDLCRTCGGTGQLKGGPCPDCEGTGRITVGIGGA